MYNLKQANNPNQTIVYNEEWIKSYDNYAKLIYEIDSDIYNNQKRFERDVQIVQNVIKKSNIKPISIIDLACGPGGHSVELAKLNPEISILGLDYSNGFLEIAKNRANQLGNLNNLYFENCDMRNIQLPDNYTNVVAMFGNSFGYFSDKKNELAFKEIQRIIKQNGILIMNLTNIDSINYLKPFAEYIVDTPSFGRLVDRRYKIWDSTTKRSVGRKIHLIQDGQVLLDQSLSIRVYTQNELQNLAKKVGFKNIELLSNIQDNKNENLGLMSDTNWYLFSK
ncbi:MAG: class I SAM-dependent methyltransferase [Bacteroidales bacterium]|nr:class I SAM-dependent methyltransferase [Bacteroidales bacterium]